MKNILYAFLLSLLLYSCGGSAFKKAFSGDFDASRIPEAPDYSLDENWAALPWVEDDADVVAKGSNLDGQQESASVDVFFIYPTIFGKKPKDRFPWNASTADTKLNERIDRGTIRQQASIFNAAGKVYSPRYRQAHLAAYYTPNEASADAAFEIAYMDVKRAFEYYLANHNKGRPIIIAAHSQGTTHGKRLIKEFFDGKPMADQFVAAYLIGIGVEPNYFTSIKLCSEASQTGCFVSWRTWQRPAAPWTKGNISFGESGYPPYALIVNPLTWTTSEEYAPASLNKGGTLLKFNIKEGRCDAQIYKGILWINEPKFFPRLLVNMKNWHVADLNLFYENVRGNAKQRAQSFMKG